MGMVSVESSDRASSPPHCSCNKGKRKKKKTVAVIGSGLAGLTAAHLLAEQGQDDDVDVEVHIFEKSKTIGMDSASIDVMGRDGKAYRVDSPMRAVQGGYYTHLLNLYNRIGVTLNQSNFTYSFMNLCEQQKDEECRQQDHATLISPSSCRCKQSHRQHEISFDSQAKPVKQQFDDTSAPSQSESILTSKKTTFIYNGGNGLSLRPFSFPRNGRSARRHEHSHKHSHEYKHDAPSLFILNLTNADNLLSLLSASTFINLLYSAFDLLYMIGKIALFAICYIYLSLLSFYHVYLTAHTTLSSTHWISKATFGTFLTHTYFPQSFINEILIPLFACVATCSPDEILEYPAAEFLEYIAKTFGADHYVVKGGVRTVVEALLRNIPGENIHLGCELVSLRRHVEDNNTNICGECWGSLAQSGTIAIPQVEQLELRDSIGNSWLFDEVIYATQANQASYLLADYVKELSNSNNPSHTLPSFPRLELEKRRLDALSRFQYTQSIVVNHYDAERTLVDDSRDKRILNIASWSTSQKGLSAENDAKLSEGLLLGEKYIMATHDLSILQPELVSPSNGAALLQTTNPTVPIAQESIVSSQRFERAKVTIESRETLKSFLQYPLNSQQENKDPTCFQGLGGIWFVGSWAAEGIPLLEGCVVSSEKAVEAIMRK